MAKYKNFSDLPHDITPASKYYFNSFWKHIGDGRGIIGEERSKITESSFFLFHEYINEKEMVFNEMYRPIKDLEIDL